MVIIITITISFDIATISNFQHVLIQKQFQAILWRPHWVRCWSGERFLFTFSHFISRFHQTGKRCSWTRCPGFVLLDVFNLERTKVVFHDVLTNIIIHCIIFLLFLLPGTYHRIFIRCCHLINIVWGKVGSREYSYDEKVKYQIFSSTLNLLPWRFIFFWEKQSCKEKKSNNVRHLVVHLFSRIFCKYFSRLRPYLRLRYLSLLYSLFFFTLERTQNLEFQWHCHT